MLRGRVVPHFWEETQGADMVALRARMAIVRAEAGVCAEFARQLAARERRQLRTTSVGVQAVHLHDAQRTTLAARRDGAHLDTTHGAVELPALETLRLRAHLTLPLGQTALAGVLPRGGQRVRVLLRVDPQLRTR